MIIYGSVDKDPAYTSQCRALISAKGVDNNVTLEGLGNAPKVLPRGWLFLNSSISEGLPLALGEAGLAGLPVVCTDVGGSREVLTNADDGRCFGRVVPPLSPKLTAAACLEVMGMLDELVDLVMLPGEVPTIRPRVTLASLQAQGPAALMLRMKEATGLRRRLGMLYRTHVLDNFALSRYLREHHQTLWIANQIQRRNVCSRTGESLELNTAVLLRDT